MQSCCQADEALGPSFYGNDFFRTKFQLMYHTGESPMILQPLRQRAHLHVTQITFMLILSNQAEMWHPMPKTYY